MNAENHTRRMFLHSALKGVLYMTLLSDTAAGSEKEQQKKSTGYVFDDEYMKHVIMPGHPESPDRLATIRQIMNESGLIKKVLPLKPAQDPMPYVAMVHTERHIENVKKIPVTGPIAAKAASGALSAVDAVMNGTVNRAFCAIRPPGHHAHNNGIEEGFCYYNNVAIAARYAQKAHGCGNVLIVDWDYHHGNGTEDAFYDDNSVFFFSTHRWPAYPMTGAPNRTGTGNGTGYNFNWPLPSPRNPVGKVIDKDIVTAFKDQLIPTLEKLKFKPDFVFISAGFDSRIGDTLGDFSISYKCFAELTDIVCGIADRYCKGRVVSVLEGGYINPAYDSMGLAKAVSEHIQALVHYDE